MASRATVAAADDAVSLPEAKYQTLLGIVQELAAQQKLLSADIVAIRQHLENGTKADQTPPETKKIDSTDLLTFKQAAGIAGKSYETIRRWSREHDLTVVVAGSTFISRAKLHAHLA